MKKYNNYNIHTPNFCFIAISLNVDIFVIVLEVLQTGESSHFSNSGSGYPHFSNSGFGYPHFSNSGSGYPHFTVHAESVDRSYTKSMIEQCKS